MQQFIGALFRVELDPKRIYGLDILRAAAILLVVSSHGKSILPDPLRIYTGLLRFDGVSVFFVLSGFLIGRILFRLFDGEKPTFGAIVNFWVQRWFRTLPAYFLVLSFLTVHSLWRVDGFELSSTRAYWCFAQNIAGPHSETFFPEAWSLSVEEWFYVLTPSAAFASTRIFNVHPRKAALGTLLAIVLFSTVFRLFRYQSVELIVASHWDGLFRKQVTTRLDSLSYGALAAYLYCFHYGRWHRYRIQLCAAGVALVIVAKSIPVFVLVSPVGLYSCVFSFTLTSIATLLLLPYFNSIERGHGVVYSIITTISLISYSMYLVNLSIVRDMILPNLAWPAVADDTHLRSLLEYGSFWTFTVLVSIVLYKYFEVPTTRIRRRFAHSSSRFVPSNALNRTS